MHKLVCKIASALAGAIVAGAIAIGAATLLQDFPGIDWLGIVAGIVAGAIVALFSYKKLRCAKTSPS